MENNNLEIAKQILHEGEIYLKETINVTDCLERKASIFLSVFLSIATASIGIAIKIGINYFSAFIFFLFFSMGLYISCYFFAKALKPKGQYLVGNHPNNLIEDFYSKEDYPAFDFAINESKNYQKMIEFNSTRNENKAKHIKHGLNSVINTIALSFSVSIFSYLLLVSINSPCFYWW